MNVLPNDVKLKELYKLEYAGNKAIFSTGYVENHPHDTLYLRLERNGEDVVCLLLRPDEMALIANLATGVLWSKMVDELPGESETGQ